MEGEYQRRPTLVYISTAWPIVIAISGIYSLLVLIYFNSDPWYWNRVIHMWRNLVPMFTQIVGYSVIAFAIWHRKNWGRLGFVLLSMFLLLFGLIFQPTGTQMGYSGPGLFVVSIGSWLLNRQEILRYFYSKDFRPHWVSKRIFRMEKDLAIGILILCVALIYEIEYIIEVGLLTSMNIRFGRIKTIFDWLINTL